MKSLASFRLTMATAILAAKMESASRAIMLLLLTSICSLVVVGDATGQTLVQYDPVGGPWQSAVPFQPTSVANTVAASDLSQVGFVGNWQNSNVWPVGQIGQSSPVLDETQYVTFDVIPNTPNNTIQYLTLSYSRRSYTGEANQQAAVRTSLDAFASNVALVTDLSPAGVEEILFDIRSLPISSDSITFRVYFFDAPTTGEDWVDLDSSANGGSGLVLTALDTSGGPVPVENLACSTIGDTGIIDATWTNPVSYDGINIFVDGVLEVTLPGGDTSYSTVPLPVGITSTLCVEPVIAGVTGGQVCCDVFLGPPAVENLACTVDFASNLVQATWTNSQPYDALNAYVNGVLNTTLPGDATTYSTPPQPPGSTVEVCIEPAVGGVLGPQSCCSDVLVQTLVQYDPVGGPWFSAVPFQPTSVANTVETVSDLSQVGFVGDWQNSNVWPVGQLGQASPDLDETQYVTFDVMPNTTIQYLTLSYSRRSYTGEANQQAAVRTSLDAFASNVALVTDLSPAGVEEILFDIRSLPISSDSITFRVYFFDAPTTGEDWVDLDSSANGGSGLVLRGIETSGQVDEILRGDFNNDGGVNFLVDALFGLNAGFVPGSPQPPCLAAADANGDRSVNFLVDCLFMLNAGFVPGSPLPPAPYPDCGPDQNGLDTLGCDNLSCP